MKFSKTHHGTFMGQYIGGQGNPNSTKQRMIAQKMMRMERKEVGWDNNIKPISKFNSQVHASARIPFEQI